jgi:hypothetical protein
VSIDDFIIELRFFVPSKELAESINILNEHYLNPEKKVRAYHKLKGRWGHRKRITELQRTIGERLYRHFATTARRRRNTDEAVSIWECIPQGMAVNLGFPSYADIDVQTLLGRRTHDVLRDLTNEFREWILARPDGYQAPWGELWMIDGDHLRLSTFERRDLPKESWCQSPAIGQAVGDLSLTRV